jgi:hypothetical protein
MECLRKCIWVGVGINLGVFLRVLYANVCVNGECVRMSSCECVRDDDDVCVCVCVCVYVSAIVNEVKYAHTHTHTQA